MTFVALVVGATGAVGRDLVAELVDSAHCSKVVALTRREIPESSWGATFPSMNVTEAANKLEIVAVDFDELHSEWTKVPVEDANAAFSCLGTTRKDAGSAEAFRKVDLEYVTNFATLAKKSGIPYFGLLTSTVRAICSSMLLRGLGDDKLTRRFQGANKDSWFLYPQTKGEVEENFKNLGFERTSIFRPGLIDRGELTRTIEFIGSYVMSTIATRTIAKAMLGDYESGLPGLHEYSDSMLRAYAAAK